MNIGNRRAYTFIFAGVKRRSPSTKGRLTVFVVTGVLAGMLQAGLPLAREKSEPPLAVADPGPGGATNLNLAPGLSFVNDSSSNFPIRGENVRDGKIASDRPTAIFFGTSHCWNTNREAERFVELYRKAKDEARFLVVDLNNPSSEQKSLVVRLYRGYIPTLAFLDQNGNVIYNRSGETANRRGETSALEEILKRARASP